MTRPLSIETSAAAEEVLRLSDFRSNLLDPSIPPDWVVRFLLRRISTFEREATRAYEAAQEILRRGKLDYDAALDKEPRTLEVDIDEFLDRRRAQSEQSNEDEMAQLLRTTSKDLKAGMASEAKSIQAETAILLMIIEREGQRDGTNTGEMIF
ncbi:Hypothetical predicted protein [Lecanosticta acicola]|uniref:Uncharacterized protein n=1 Tax=Lecanosticta acicola TaxID=111012 RepID=A0AAI8YVT9_9PEZI|nr:Hypothetical predicted protein [Lecanosticta acicola]